jgi:hypothetical protein
MKVTLELIVNACPEWSSSNASAHSKVMLPLLGQTLHDFRIAGNSGVITRWLESKCRAPLLHSYQISTS